MFLGLKPYWREILSLRAGNGKVEVQKVGLVELAIAALLVTWLGLVLLQGLTGPKRALDERSLVSASSFFAGIVLFLGSFLYLRGIAVGAFLGATRVKLPRVISTAIGLLVCILPLVVFASLATQMLLGARAESQEIVEFFLQAIQTQNQRAIWMVFGLGVIVAPVAEEFIFRGFLYPVFKRFLGMPLALLITAALFAAIHANAGSLGALFILAAAFTIAYEKSGSILVPICMHALFNLISLSVLFFSAGTLK